MAASSSIGSLCGTGAAAAVARVLSDNVFGDDGGVHELATVTGSVDAGYAVQLAVPVGSA
jgi:hypothetical protein